MLYAHLFIQRTHALARAWASSSRYDLHVYCVLPSKTFSPHTISLLGVPTLSSFCSTPPPSWTPSPETLTGIRPTPCALRQKDGQFGPLAARHPATASDVLHLGLSSLVMLRVCGAWVFAPVSPTHGCIGRLPMLLGVAFARVSLMLSGMPDTLIKCLEVTELDGRLHSHYFGSAPV